MKRKLFLILPGILSSFLFFSCAGGPGSMPSAELGSNMAPAKVAGTFDKRDWVIDKEERPGLATGWGKEKNSELLDKNFVRASSKPAGTDAIFYNSKDGIKAMAKYPESVEGLQTAAGGLVEWGIKGGFGFLPSYKDQYRSRRLVAGENDGSYSIFIRNRSKSALEIVASVDGLDVNDGKPASFSKQGYVIGAGETLSIDGFRTSRKTVASFKFSSVSNSYSNMRYGDTRNVGVIGLAVFTQKGVSPWTWMPKEVNTRSKARIFAEAPAH